jgi:8-oxo-dGTP pyrophosphatase MutT (NUDIX family)
MLARDSDRGIEVFMLQRTTAAVFVGGFHVFPGGAVDDADRAHEVEAVCDGRTDVGASDALGLESGGLAFWVAAVRECFEEAGVLLAVDPDGKTVSFDDPATAERFAADRHAVHDGTLRLVEVCRRENVRLSVGTIHYVSHWITPIGEPRRFDTRFFLARAPQSQEPLHDDGETIASLWTRPADALDRFRAGELLLLHPTIANLEFLADHDSAEAAMAAAQQMRRPPTVRPRMRRVGKRVEILLPGDPGYDELA